MKDKIEAGTYIVTCQVIDRLGGQPLFYKPDSQVKELDKFRQKVVRYEALKK